MIEIFSLVEFDPRRIIPCFGRTISGDFKVLCFMDGNGTFTRLRSGCHGK